MFWKDRDVLLVADLHLGKAAHFRKEGIAVPAHVHQTDLAVLSRLVSEWNPGTLIVLGDLFHSRLNNDWLFFLEWLDYHPDLKVELVKGNHDIIPSALFEAQNITVHEEINIVPPFIFSHIPLDYDRFDSSLYNLCGHIHPSVTLQGRGRQRLVLPCFYFSDRRAYLPAFGRFTGTARIAAKPKDEVFVICEEKVLKVG